jgi:hypothetical protein
MRLFEHHFNLRRPATLLGALALIGAMHGCGLDEVHVPTLVGPSETGLSLDLKAFPDRVNADGVSQSVVRIQARDQNGKNAPGRQLVVQLGGSADGFLVAGSVLVGPLQTGASLSTDTNGVAQVVYTAGTSTNTMAVINVTPYSFDATQSPFQRTVTVSIEQQ